MIDQLLAKLVAEQRLTNHFLGSIRFCLWLMFLVTVWILMTLVRQG